MSDRYAELLRDPRWQRKRLEIMQRADFKCEVCGDDGTTLNVHHIRYVRGRKPWEYDASELRCLCEPCHGKEHGITSAQPTRAAGTKRIDDPAYAELVAYLEECDRRLIAAYTAGDDDATQAALRDKRAIAQDIIATGRSAWAATRRAYR